MITRYRRPVIYNLLDAEGKVIKTNSIVSNGVHYNTQTGLFVVSCFMSEGRHLVDVRRSEDTEVLIVNVTHLED